MSDDDVIEEVQIKEPSMWAILFHNDDYTPFEFVIAMLQKYLHKSTEEATQLAAQVHVNGSYCVEVCTYDLAETISTSVMLEAASEGHPLKVTIERA
jgi:ATP-dependent Clp protease adaptor protein ClpS